MNANAIFVRICFLTGAIFDVIFVFPLMLPSLFGMMLGINNYSPDANTIYVMHAGAALMAGWAGILFWAAVKPIERRGIIPITLFPLLSGLIAAGIYFYISGGIELAKIVPLWMVSIILLIGQAIGYFITRNSGNRSKAN
jgi:hypothetical protein